MDIMNGGATGPQPTRPTQQILPKKNFWKIAGIAAGVLVIVFLGIKIFTPGNQAGQAPGAGEVGGAAGVPAPRPQTMFPVPAGTTVPRVNTQNVPVDIAKPQTAFAETPGSVAMYERFSIVVANNQFSPGTIIVRQGDIAHINITAEDKDYDFFQPDLNLLQQLPKGVARLVEAQMNSAGKFLFYCKSCGGPKSGPVGYIIVVSK